MEVFDINSESRVLAGRSMLRKIKSEGFVPGVLYSEDGSIPVSLEEHSLRGVLDKFGDDVLVKIVHNGKPVVARVKEVQRNPITQEINHIDLMPVEKDDGSEKNIH